MAARSASRGTGAAAAGSVSAAGSVAASTSARDVGPQDINGRSVPEKPLPRRGCRGGGSERPPRLGPVRSPRRGREARRGLAQLVPAFRRGRALI
eukprot:6666892-Heterocapsa_arctica.AAC.1